MKSTDKPVVLGIRLDGLTWRCTACGFGSAVLAEVHAHSGSCLPRQADWQQEIPPVRLLAEKGKGIESQLKEETNP